MSFDAGDRTYPYYDEEVQTMVIAHYGDYMVSVTPMIFNDRVLLTTRDEYPLFVKAGFCYDKGAAAVLAAKAWNPLTEQQPVGWKKVAFDGREGNFEPTAP